MVELVDAGSGRSGRKPVGVRVPPSALQSGREKKGDGRWDLSPSPVSLFRLPSSVSRPVVFRASPFPDPTPVILQLRHHGRRKSPDAEEGRESIARNPKATHDYHILETWEAGIVSRAPR